MKAVGPAALVAQVEALAAAVRAYAPFDRRRLAWLAAFAGVCARA
jgi:hypothetical protein